MENNNLKLCTKCKQYKEKIEFDKDPKGIYGLSYWCKSCKAEYRRQNSKQIQEYNRKYRENHKEYFVKYEKENKERIKEKREQYRLTHKEQRKQYQIIYDNKPENKERKRIISSKYRKENAEFIKNSYLLHRQERLQKGKEKYYTNSQHRLSVVVSSNIYHALKGAKSEQHWEDLVGYTINDLKQHLEKQFTPEMSWGNYGSYWEIDHIIPKNLFNYSSHEDKDFKICWSLNNLRPLTVFENRSRPKNGSDISNELKYKILNNSNNTHTRS